MAILSSWKRGQTGPRRGLACVAIALAIGAVRGEASAQTADDVLVGLPGMVRTISGSIVLPNAVRATWLDNRYILVAGKDHGLSVFDTKTRASRALAMPAPATKLGASWHWVVSPDRRWAFVIRGEVERLKYRHGAPTGVAAEAKTINWSGFVDLATGKTAVPYQGRCVGWQGARCIVTLASRGPLILVDPRDATRAKWLFDESGEVKAVSPDGRFAVSMIYRYAQVWYFLLDLEAAIARPLDFTLPCEPGFAFSADWRHFVIVAPSCAGPPATAQVRMAATGRLTQQAVLPHFSPQLRLVALAGTPSRFALLAERLPSARLIHLTLGDTLRVEENRVPLPRYPVHLAVPNGKTAYWISSKGTVVRYERGRATVATEEDVEATFVAWRGASWWYVWDEPYWPVDRYRWFTSACDSAAECLAKGTELVAATRSYEERKQGFAMLEYGCALHDGQACYTFGRAPGPHGQGDWDYWSLRKACVIGVAGACEAAAVAGRPRQ